MEKKITTAGGIEIEFLNIAAHLDMLNQQRAKHLPPTPTYSVTTALGVSETHPHYKRIVQVKEIDDAGNPTDKLVPSEETSLTTDDERAAWDAYEAELNATQVAYAEKFTKTVMLYGLQFEMPPDAGWVSKQEFVGIEIPSEPLARRWHWIQTELVPAQVSAEVLITGVLAASGTDEEVISAMEAIFRGAVGGTDGDTAERPGNSNGRQGVVSDKPLRAGGRGGKKRHPAHK